ncbi:MAG: hypothetical protein HY823_05570 [Acidobacteria bacterium]|nr:hypothetical protein [Acidobacteriota bacterium]
MPTFPLRHLSLPLLGAVLAPAQELPLALNLPLPVQLEAGQLGLRFTHRFEEQVRSNGKEAGGLDGYAYAALGVDLGVPGVRGLNAQVYRSADQKTLVLALQQALVSRGSFQASLRVERWDESVRSGGPGLVATGKLGGAVQLPAAFSVGGGVQVLAVPTYLTRTHTQRDGVFNVGAAFRWEASESHLFTAEYYPVPSKVQDRRVVPWPQGGRRFEAAWALGYTLRTKGHRFSLMATTTPGTTAAQVLSGDYAGLGARRSGDWGLGFNVIRIL